MSILESYTLLTALKNTFFIVQNDGYGVTWLLNGFSASALMKCPLLDVSKRLVEVKSTTN